MARIAKVAAHVLEAALSQPFSWSFNRATTRASCLVEITAEDGTTGWGECFGPARLTAAVVEAMAPLLIGGDARATDLHWLTLYDRFRDQGQRGVVVCALSGIDIALWDLKGRLFEAPVHVLMGGPLRDRVPAYATGTYRLETGDPRDYVIEEINGYAAEGFGAVKLKIGFDPKADIELIRLARAALGPDVGLMLDANHGYDAIEAVAVGRAVADCDIGWFEEPVAPGGFGGAYEEVRRGQTIPVAGGECHFTRYDFKEIIARRAIDIIQPDTCACGGLSEAKKIADMAFAHGVRYAPHVWGTGVGLATALQLLAVLPHSPPRHTPRSPLLEFDRSEHPFRQAVLTTPIEHVAGVVRVPEGPGLGIEVDRAALGRFRVA